MKHIKHSIITILIFLCGLTYAQTNRFVELTVTDTFSLKPTKIIYQVSVGNKADMYSMLYNTEEKKEDDIMEKAQLKDITKMLDQEKFTYTVSEDLNYNTSKSFSASSPSAMVTLNSEAELKRLLTVMKNMEGISGKVQDVKYEPMSNYSQTIYKNLFEKGKKMASQMAAVSGGSIGNLISVTDVPAKSNGLDFYASLLKNVDLLRGEGNVTNKTEEITMTFKFELK